MYESAAAIGDMRYNPATESFEALVTFDSAEGRTRVAAEYPAPLDTDEDAAMEGLRTSALASLHRPGALQSRVAARRKDIGAGPRGGLSNIRELFGNLFGNRAA